MRRFVLVLTCGLLGLFACVMPTHAAVTTARQGGVNWTQRDCAVYVVSTMNLLRSRDGHTLSSILMQKYDITHFDVYDDVQSTTLYFIELKRDDGSTFGTLAYQMGWQKPMSISSSLDKFHVRRAPSTAGDAYHNDSKVMIGSFTSTLPS